MRTIAALTAPMAEALANGVAWPELSRFPLWRFHR